MPTRLRFAVKRDLDKDPSAISAVVRDLLEDGQINSQPQILVDTTKVILREAAPEKLASIIHTLLGNESVRLAIIVYARSKGIEISQQDLDQVRKAIDPEQPNLGTLLVPAYQHLIKRFGKGQALDVLGQFVAQ